MSHRVTTQTTITEKKIAIAALKAAGWSYTESGNNLRISSGPMARSTINLSNGEVFGDADHVNDGDSSMGALNQGYSEALVRANAMNEGYEVEGREIEHATGDIILHCVARFA